MTTTKEWLTSFLDSGAIIRRDNDYLIGWQLKPIAKPSGICFFQSDFFLQNKQWWHPENFKICSKSELITLLTPFADPISPLDWKLYSKHTFFPVYDDIKMAFKASKFEKIVPAIYHESSTQLSRHHRAKLLLSALHYVSDIHDYLYGIWSTNQGILGVSPEQLFTYDIHSQSLQTMAVAGTLKSTYPPSQLLQSAKDNHEHALVVQGIQEVLQDFGHVHFGHRQVMTINSFHHLYTPMSCHYFNPFEFDKIIHALHPTPALGGYPQKNSFQWLRNHKEQNKRSLFGAPFGICDENNNYHMIVCIRNIQWQKNNLSVWAGCGMVPESQFESEWDELSAKIASVKSMFNV